MAFFITGDTHGDFRRFLPERFYEQETLTKEDFVTVCGDLGGVWYGDHRDDEGLDFLERRPFTTLFVAGNHENYDAPWAEPAATMSRTASWSRTIPSFSKSSNGSTQEGRPSGSTTDPGGKRSCPARRSTRKHEGIWNVQAGRWTTSSRTARPPASRMNCSRRYPGRTNSQTSWRRCGSGAGSGITSSDTTTAIW